MGDFEQMLNDLCKMSKAQLVQMVRNTDEVETALNIFKNVMKEDYARVLRCKDCRYLGRELDKELYSCDDYNLPYCEPDSYCSHGRRNEETKHAAD